MTLRTVIPDPCAKPVVQSVTCSASLVHMVGSGNTQWGGYTRNNFRSCCYLAAVTLVIFCLVKPSVIEGCHVVMMYINSCKMCPTNFLKLSRNI